MEVSLPSRQSLIHPEEWKKANLKRERKYIAHINNNNTSSSMTVEESRFQDQTMLTESCSMSSETGREGPEMFGPMATTKLRFPDEPIIFSHHGPTISGSQLWLEEGDLNLYLLHDSGDAWHSNTRKSCTETLKKLLTLRSCISLGSLRQMGDAPKRKFASIGKESTAAEGMAYSILKDRL
jgi:hypothetical protein